jgi:hypothetical protein
MSKSRVLSPVSKHKKASYVVLDKYSPVSTNTGNRGNCTETYIDPRDTAALNRPCLEANTAAPRFADIPKSEQQLLEEIKLLQLENRELDKDIDMIKHPQYTIFITQTLKNAKTEFSGLKKEYLALEKENKANVKLLACKYRLKSLNQLKSRKFVIESTKELRMDFEKNRKLKREYSRTMDHL